MNVTEEYQRLLPLFFHSASPELASVHAVRHRLLRTETTKAGTEHPNICSSCGSILTPDKGSIRVQSKRKHAPRPTELDSTQSIHKSCRVCSTSTLVPIEFNSSRASFQSVRRRNRAKGVNILPRVDVPTSESIDSTLISTPPTLSPSSSASTPPVKSIKKSITRPNSPNLSIPPSPQVPSASHSPSPVRVLSPSIPSASTSAVTPAPPKNKKRMGNGLQAMLERNRQQKQKAKEAASSSTNGIGNLASFLDGL